MHILVIPSWYPSASSPLNGTFFAEQAEMLSRHGHRVSVFPVYSDDPSSCHVEITRKGDLTEYAIHVKPLPLHLTYFRVLAAMRSLLRRELAGARPDIIHVHSFNAIRYARALKALYGIPFVVTEHVTWFERGLLSEKDLRSITRDYAAADALVAVSPGLRGQIEPYCSGKEIRVIPNMVSERFFENGLHAPPGESFGFISVGMLDRKKGFDVLLHAFAELIKTSPEARLTICGDGAERAALEKLRGELGLAERVTFTGGVSREEVARRLRENQAFVLPSRTETFGVVYVEAMACGLPIVMTKTNAWQLLALPETGLAVEIEDVPGLTAAMHQVVEHYDDYDPKTIAALCRERFSEAAVARELTALYNEILNR